MRRVPVRQSRAPGKAAKTLWTPYVCVDMSNESRALMVVPHFALRPGCFLHLG